MSESDSFLSEVTEEVRRDQMTAFVRKHAVWIATVVIVIVGGVALLEWQKAADRAAAEARGDAVWAALDIEAGDARIAALDQIDMGSADGAAMLDFQRVASFLNAERREDAVAVLQAMAGRGDVSDPLRNVARLKLAGLGAGTLSLQEREDLLLPMLEEGHAMRALALEQRAYLRLEAGETAAAVADLEAVGNDERAPAEARNRAERLLDILAPAGTANG